MGEIGYKGFGKGLVCRGKQYAENTIFEEPEADVCKKGMHYCKNPFDVLDYYDLVNSDGSFNEFATVVPLAEEKTNDNKKYCTTKLKIGAKFTISGFIKACVDFVIEKTKCEEFESDNSENSAQIGSSGYSAKIGSSGDCAQIGSSGNYAQIGSSGYSAKIGSSGNYAQIGSSGDSAKIGSSGDSAKIDSSGMYAVVMCAGHDCVARAKKGSFITLAEWKYDDEIGMYIPVHVKTRKVDGKHIKEDTYYRLEDGKFVEV